jgi:small GTP-binding protein
MQYDTTCSILLLGDSCVGKTSLISRYANGIFKDEYIATVGLDFVSKQEIINDKNINVKLWDTAGQERYKALTPSYLRGADGVVLVYDVTNSETFDNLKFWIDSLKNNLGENNTFLPIVINGNKIDIDDRDISKEDANKFAQENNYKYFETSAKSGVGVDELFREIVNQILEYKDKTEEIKEERKSIKINENKGDNQKKKGCC